MEICENKDYKELYAFEYTWIIRNFEQDNGGELMELESDDLDTSRYRISSTKCKSHHGNHEWLLSLIQLVKVIDEENHDERYAFYMEVSCNNDTNNFNVFHEKKIEILIKSLDENFDSVKVEGCVKSKDQCISILLFDSYILNKTVGLVNDAGDLTLLIRVTEPTSTAINTHEIRKLSCDYENLLKSGDCSDFKIIIGEKIFLVHKNILSARSEYFAAMFKHGTKEQERNAVEISDVRYEVMNQVLKYIYCAKFDIEEDLSFFDLLTTADMYQISDLKKKCEGFIIDHLRSNNVGECLVYAEKYNNQYLKEATIHFLTHHASEFNGDDIKLLNSNLMSISSPFVTNLVCGFILKQKVMD